MKQLFLFLPGLLSCALSAQQPVFTSVTDASNPVVVFANTPAPYKGLAWIDFDHDNLPDLFMSQRFLFHNDGDGQFTQLTALPGGQGGQIAAGSSWGDIDNDGDPDCITASSSSGLHLNGGNGAVFSIATATIPGLANFAAWDCVLADADNNGWLDLLFVHAEGFHNTGPSPCKFYLQTAPGTFVQQSGFEFTDINEPYTIPSWTDFDLDGDLDLFIGSGPGNSLGPDYRYKNMLIETGAFGLQRMTAAPFHLMENGQVYNFVDYDNDGDMDGLLTNYAGVVSRFWKNNNGVLEETAMPFTLSANTYLSNAWGDVDNDGYLDLLLSVDVTRQVRLYRNNKNGGFLPMEVAGVADTSVCGIALADYDNDGDLDFATNGMLSGRGLFRNDTLANGRHWIAFTLTGSNSNRSAIGALVRIKTVIDGQPVWMMREVLAHNSFQSQHELRQHFGLGDANSIDSLEIRWPSGLIQQFGTQVADHFYNITEGASPEVVSTRNIAKREPPAVKITPNPGSGLFRLSVTGTETSIREIEVIDSLGKVAGSQLIHTNGDQYEVRLAPTTPAGTYWIQIRFESGQSRSEKLIKN